MQTTQDDVIAWLRQQSDKRFFETVYEAARDRKPDALDEGWLESHVILGYARRDKLSDGNAPWSVEVVALPRDSRNQPADEVPAEAGSHCGHALISWAKEIRCPFCGTDTYAT
jgi:hypothetical protein